MFLFFFSHLCFFLTRFRGNDILTEVLFLLNLFDPDSRWLTHCMFMCVLPSQVVCLWLPPAAAEALEGAVQPCAAGPWVYGADADRCLSRHVCIKFWTHRHIKFTLRKQFCMFSSSVHRAVSSLFRLSVSGHLVDLFTLLLELCF